MSYIYKITNLINNKCYIGKTDIHTIQERFKEHIKDSKRYTDRPLYRAFNKYGIENFTIEEIEKCDIKDSCNREKYWIEYYGSFKNGYNATIGGDGKAYIDRELVIKTYNEVQNCQKTAEICNVHVSSVYNILKSNNILIKSAQEIAKENGKTIAMLDMNLNIIKIFSSLADAARFIKPSVDQKSIRGVVSHIRDVAKGRRKTAYNYKWKFI